MLELKATDVSFGPVSDSDVDVAPPAGAQWSTELEPAAGRTTTPGTAAAKVAGVDAVQRKLDFQLVAPDALAGLPRQEVRLVQLRRRAPAR